jgi:taurine dioxygenase
MAITIHPLSPVLGAEVRGIDLRAGPDDAAFARIIEAWHQHLVLVFRGQELDSRAQARFCRRFGEFVRPKSAPQGAGAARAGDPNAMIVSNIKKDGKWIGSLPVGALSFHSDGAFHRTPYKASMLYAIEVPDEGGETVFASMYAVYEALDAETKALLEDCTADNFFEYDGQTEYRENDEGGPDKPPHHVHPVVVSHPVTGRKLLFISRRMTKKIFELKPEIYQPVLARIFDMVEAPAFTYAHEWRPGDLVVWDNRCTQHGRRDFDPAARRLLRRFAIRGDTQPSRDVPPDRRVAI